MGSNVGFMGTIAETFSLLAGTTTSSVGTLDQIVDGNNLTGFARVFYPWSGATYANQTIIISFDRSIKIENLTMSGNLYSRADTWYCQYQLYITTDGTNWSKVFDKVYKCNGITFGLDFAETIPLTSQLIKGVKLIAKGGSGAEFTLLLLNLLPIGKAFDDSGFKAFDGTNITPLGKYWTGTSPVYAYDGANIIPMAMVETTSPLASCKQMAITPTAIQAIAKYIP